MINIKWYIKFKNLEWIFIKVNKKEKIIQLDIYNHNNQQNLVNGQYQKVEY